MAACPKTCIWFFASLLSAANASIALGSTQLKPTGLIPTATPLSVCHFELDAKKYEGEFVAITGHIFRGVEGAMVFDDSCKAYLPLIPAGRYFSFTYPESTGLYVVKGLIQRRPNYRAISGAPRKGTHLVLVEISVDPLNLTPSQTPSKVDH